MIQKIIEVKKIFLTFSQGTKRKENQSEEIFFLAFYYLCYYIKRLSIVVNFAAIILGIILVLT